MINKTLNEDEILQNKYTELTKDLMMIVDNHEDDLTLDQIFYVAIRHMVTGAYVGFDGDSRAYDLVSLACSDAIQDYSKHKEQKIKDECDNKA